MSTSGSIDIYGDDGSSASLGISVAAGGASGWLNARDYGASGDGSTDDTAALNAACSAARTLPGTGNGVAVVYLPTGIYKITSTINVANVCMKGDGVGATRINAASDWATTPNGSWALDQQPSSAGVGKPAPDASHIGVSPLQGTTIEDLWLNGPRGGVTRGVPPCNLSGVRVGGGAGHSRLRIDGFFAGSFLFSDHERLIGPGQQGGNYYGIYRGEPSQSSGDQVVTDIHLDGSAWASIGISAHTNFGGALFRRLHLGAAPFGIYKEGATGSALIVGGCTFKTVQFESCGNGNIFVGGPAGVGADIQSCVFDMCPSVNAIDPGVMVPLSTTDCLGNAIGRTVAPIDLGTGQWLDNEVLGADLAYPHPGITNYQAQIACGVFIGGRYGPAMGGIDRVVADGKQLVRGGNVGDAILMYRGTFCRLLRASDSGELTGDLLESSGGGQPGCQRSTGGRRAVGVAMHPANNADSVPVAFSGMVNIRVGTNTIAANDPLVADATQVGCVRTGTLSSPGIIGTAQKASQAGFVTALLQGL